ncbi:hypothetical protein BGW41_002801 [Actinomortierella wolfii]|nr:hypothetical protein BGW41_002801 [Actinomortierella wolfii]
MPTSSSDNNNDNSNRHQTMNIGKPLHSPAVLLVLGMVATCLTIAIVIKCYRIKRRNNATLMHECRRRDIEAQRTLRLRYGQTYQHGLSSSPSSPSLLSPPPPPISSYPTLFMSENGTGVAMAGRTTLAARLRIYHEMAALNSGRFGPPPDNGIGSRMTELDDTLPQSTVAPGYYDDISPPSFQATIGNPPPYEESLQRLPT